MRPNRWARGRTRSIGIPLLVFLTASSSLFTSVAESQEGCEFVYPSGDLSIVTLAGGDQITYVGTPHMICSDGVEIWADSSISYAQTGLDHLIGNIRFLDSTGELRADEARYFSEKGRLQASGNVFVQDTIDGITIQNGDLVYLLPTDFRKEAEITVSIADERSKPQAVLHMFREDSLVTNEDSQDAPYTVTGDQIFLRGSDYFNSVGNVTIARDSLLAFADSAEYEGESEGIHLFGAASVEVPSYNLVGETIDMTLETDSFNKIVAYRDAVLEGEELTISSSEIQLYLNDGVLERLVAATPPIEGVAPFEPLPIQPLAVGKEFRLTADSLDIVIPEEVMETIFAAGNARSVSLARDSLNVASLPEVANSDWLEGDTIVITFNPTTSAPLEAAPSMGNDDQQNYRVETITAKVQARSLYRLTPSDTTASPGIDPPAIHYVTGDEITILMREGQADRLEVQGRTHGFHLEPLSSSEPDSSGVDSTRIDTTRVNGPVARVHIKSNVPMSIGSRIQNTEPRRRPYSFPSAVLARAEIQRTWRSK